MRKVVFWVAEHPTLTISLCLLTAFVLLNLLAYRHAWTMTHFVSANRRTRRTSDLRGHATALSFVERLQLAVKGVALARPHDELHPHAVDLPWESHTFVGGGGQLAAWYIPHEQPAGLILLFHGYANSKAQLLAEAQAFHEFGYACFLVDFRGSGDSDGDRTSIGYYEADDVERAVAYVRERWPQEPLILFGHSMGAAAVLRALSRYALEPEAVLLECPFDRLLSTVEARFAATRLPSFPAAQLLVFWGGLQHGFNGFDHNPSDYARQVTCPVLLMCGLCDNRVSRQQIEAIYANLAGEKELHFFECLGHHSYVASRPQEWKECVARFLHSQAAVESITDPSRARSAAE